MQSVIPRQENTAVKHLLLRSREPKTNSSDIKKPHWEDSQCGFGSFIKFLSALCFPFRSPVMRIQQKTSLSKREAGGGKQSLFVPGYFHSLKQTTSSKAFLILVRGAVSALGYPTATMTRTISSLEMPKCACIFSCSTMPRMQVERPSSSA